LLLTLFLKDYQRIYKHYAARCDDNEYPFEKFPKSKFYNITLTEWRQLAGELRQKYYNGEISGAGLINDVQGKGY
jgi:hypothetical protein